VRSRDFSRTPDVSVRDGSTAELTASLGSFFGTVQQIKQKVDEEDDLRRSREVLNYTMANRGEAVNAVKTGDYSALPPRIQDALAYKSGFNMLRRSSGRVNGSQMADSYMDQLASDPMADPELLQQKVLQDELKGSDDIFGEAAMQTFLEMTSKSVSSHKQARIADATVRNFKLMRDDIQTQLKSGTVWTPQDITRLEATAFGIGSLVGSETALKYREAAVFEMMKFASDPDNGGRAMYLMDIENEDGIRLADRYPSEALAAREHWLQSEGKMQTAAEKQNLDDIEQTMLTQQGTPMELITSVSRHEELFGRSDASQSMRSKLLTKLGDSANINGLLDSWRTGDLSSLTRKAWSKAGHTAVASGIQEAASMLQNGNTEEAGTLIAAMAANMGVQESTTELKNLMSQLLLREDTRAAATSVLTRIEAASANASDFVTTDAKGLWETIYSARLYGLPEDEAITAYQQTKAAGVTQKPETVFRELHALSASDVADLTVDHAEMLLEAVQADDMLGGVEALSPSAASAVRQSAQEVAARHPEWTPEQSFQYAQERLKDRLVPAIVDDQVVAVLQHPFARRVQTDINGQPIHTRKYSTDDLRELQTTVDKSVKLKTQETPLELYSMEGPLGNQQPVPFSASGIDPNNLDVDGGALVTLRSERTGAQFQAVGAAGERRVFSAAEAGSEIWRNMPQEVNKDGTVTVTMAPGRVSERMAWTPNPFSSGQLQLRVYPPRVKSPQEVRSELEQRRRELLDRPPTGHQFLMEGPLGLPQYSAGPLPGQSQPHVPTGDKTVEGFRKERNKQVDELLTSGKLSPDLATTTRSRPAPRNELEAMVDIEDALTQERGRARFMTNFLAPEHHDFRQRVVDNGYFWEGYRPYVYDAGDDKATVGYGLNITNNENAAKFMRIVGLDIGKVRDGTQTVPEPIARKLLELDMAHRATELTKKFTPEERSQFSEQAWEGMLDLSYNAQPGLFTPTKAPKMMAALKEGRMGDAAYEVAVDTMKGIPEKLAPGVMARRYWEASKIAGVSVDQLSRVNPNIPPYRKALEQRYPGILERLKTTIDSAERRIDGQ
jgi:GH24 family phage-related lysozyme (muramidase)